VSSITTLRPSEAARSSQPVAGVVVFSRSELIGDGVVGLLPRDWRERIAIVSDLSELRRRLDGQRTAVIVDAGGEDAEAATRLIAVHGGSAILIVGSDARGLEPDVLELADAIVDRDDAEPLTLRTALAAGRLGMRLVPRSSPAPAGAAPVLAPSLSDTARRAMALLADGMRDAEIARELNLSESAVRKLVQRTVRALGARTRCQAVALAARAGELTVARTPT
jgi:DNA-binding CsgD family transcriptional regulator